jgi:hypothetical protein
MSTKAYGLIAIATLRFRSADTVQISHEQKSTLPISPILSVISLVAGVGLVAAGMRAK